MYMDGSPGGVLFLQEEGVMDIWKGGQGWPSGRREWKRKGVKLQAQGYLLKN